MQMEGSFLQIKLKYELGFGNENVMRMKMGYFKKSCVTNCHKMPKLANVGNGGTNIQKGIQHTLLNSCEYTYCTV